MTNEQSEQMKKIMGQGQGGIFLTVPEPVMSEDLGIGSVTGLRIICMYGGDLNAVEQALALKFAEEPEFLSIFLNAVSHMQRVLVSGYSKSDGL